MRLLPYSPQCFICGKDNPLGLHLPFYRDGDQVIAWGTITEPYAGYAGYAHGGTISAILDEAMGRLTSSLHQVLVVTGNLNVRFHRPLPVGVEIQVVALMEAKQRTHHRFWDTMAKITNKQSGELYSSATARFFAMHRDKEPEMLRVLKLEGVERPVTLQDL